jgi:hypothetical protein
MKRTMMGLCMAAAFGFVASLGAQSATSSQSTTSDKDVTVTGCLERGANGNYMLANAQKENGMSGTSTGTTGTTGSATTGSTSATGSSAMNARSGGETWTLEGSSTDLDKHVGHKIEVTGKEVSSSMGSATGTSSTTGTTGTTATGTSGTTSRTSNAQKLDVKSVKMISTNPKGVADGKLVNIPTPALVSTG